MPRNLLNVEVDVYVSGVHPSLCKTFSFFLVGQAESPFFFYCGDSPSSMVVVVFNHNIPVRFINQLKLKGLSRSHPVHMAYGNSRSS